MKLAAGGCPDSPTGRSRHYTQLVSKAVEGCTRADVLAQARPVSSEGFIRAFKFKEGSLPPSSAEGRFEAGGLESLCR